MAVDIGGQDWLTEQLLKLGKDAKIEDWQVFLGKNCRNKVTTREEHQPFETITDTTLQAARTSGGTTAEAPPRSAAASSSAPGSDEDWRNYLRLLTRTERPTLALSQPPSFSENLKKTLPGLAQTASLRSLYSPQTPLDTPRSTPKKDEP